MSDENDEDEDGGSVRNLMKTQMVLVIMLMGIMMRVMMMFTMHCSDDDHGHQEDGSPRVCLALPGLTEQQANVCEKLPETVESVPFGTKQVGSCSFYSYSSTKLFET